MLRMQVSIFLSVFLFATTTAFAAEHAATVIVKRGTVKTGKGRVLELKAKVFPGEEIQTANRSFVKLLFRDNTQMNIGPNSKTKVEFFKKGKPGLVNVVTGGIRAKVNQDFVGGKKEKKRVRMMIRSKTAAMGVRGTTVDFNVANRGGEEVVEMAVLEGDAVAITGDVENIASQITSGGEAAVAQQVESSFQNAVPIPEGQAAEITSAQAAQGTQAAIQPEAIPAAELQALNNDPTLATVNIPAVEDPAMVDAAANAIASAAATAGEAASVEEIATAIDTAATAVTGAIESGGDAEAISTSVPPPPEGSTAPTDGTAPSTTTTSTSTTTTSTADGATTSGETVLLAPPGISSEVFLGEAEAPEGVDSATLEAAETSISSDTELSSAIAEAEVSAEEPVVVTFEEAAILAEGGDPSRETSSEDSAVSYDAAIADAEESFEEEIVQPEYPTDDEACPDICTDPNDPFGGGVETTVTFSISVN